MQIVLSASEHTSQALKRRLVAQNGGEAWDLTITKGTLPGLSFASPVCLRNDATAERSSHSLCVQSKKRSDGKSQAALKSATISTPAIAAAFMMTLAADLVGHLMTRLSCALTFTLHQSILRLMHRRLAVRNHFF